MIFEVNTKNSKFFYKSDFFDYKTSVLSIKAKSPKNDA